MKKKILIHSPNLSTPGGKQTYFASLLNHFTSDIEFFFYGAQGKKEGKLRVITRLISDFWKFYRKLKKNKYDLVHLNPSMNMKSFFRDSVFALICRLSGTRMTVFWHGWQWEFEKKVTQRILPWFRATFGKADSMIVLGKEFADQLRKYGYKKPIYPITTVADPIFFKLENKFEKAETSNHENDGITLLFLSRIERVKGIYEALESFVVLQKRFPNVKLKIAGTGGELPAVEEYVRSRQMKGVELLGWITGDNKAKVFYESDIYLLPSYHGEGLPCSILEAMATGLPVISTDVGGIKDFFEDGQMGYLVEMKHPEQITEKVSLLINDRDSIRTMGQYNIVYAHNRFTPEKVSSELERIYSKSILGS
ncbi:glycosyltransferase family 4 protein [Zobellia galactanivorans]|uniref:glycosyltransferase family 4 protein n=1 Tax=Zobellia galactanivorans (strain DSM 12802 / CCUG 47099 / CIP 106680 / NCIMB 13871 / Dsij) TaxID=63186 RepID=UPI0026E2B0C6|nr:glycosyltransferase family 4 protein [Zobellia galactanivorans]MDO6809971.1 glycosyltransferase family 4 protein [Zobellia galactanivorans]